MTEMKKKNKKTKKTMKIKFNSDDELPLNKIIEIPTMAIVVRDVSMKMINIIHNFFQMNVCMNYEHGK